MADDKGDLKYYQNQPYDLEVDLGHDDDDNFNDNIPDTLAQKQPEYEQEDDNNTIINNKKFKLNLQKLNHYQNLMYQNSIH